MKVTMLVATRTDVTNPRVKDFLEAGEVVDVDDQTAERWIRLGLVQKGGSAQKRERVAPPPLEGGPPAGNLHPSEVVAGVDPGPGTGATAPVFTAEITRADIGQAPGQPGNAPAPETAPPPAPKVRAAPSASAGDTPKSRPAQSSKGSTR